jgi:hypothetical protein
MINRNNIITFQEFENLIKLIKQVDLDNSKMYDKGQDVFSYADRYNEIIDILGSKFYGDTNWSMFQSFLYDDSYEIKNIKELYDKMHSNKYEHRRAIHRI